MLNIKLGKIIEYATLISNAEESEKAFVQFFDKYTPNDFEEKKQEQVIALFNEWLIFEFINNRKQRFIDLYYFNNPDNLSKQKIDELKQIIETEHFEFLEIGKIKRGYWFMAYGFITKKEYKIYDRMGSASLPTVGVLPGRIAKVNGKWYLVGCDTFVLPISYTKRAKKMMSFSANQKERISCKQLLDFYLPRKQTKINYTVKEIKNKRKNIKKKYQKMVKKSDCIVDVKEVINLISNENYKNAFADWIEDLMNLGIPFNMLKKGNQLFQDLWNFFPHKSLNDLCPVEMLAKEHGVN